MSDVRGALLFDVQGTATDFFVSVSAALRRIDAGRNPAHSWEPMVERWRAGYCPKPMSARW